MTIDTNDLADLAAKAKDATPGPWRHDDLDAFDEFPSEVSAVIDGPDGLLAECPTGIFQREGDDQNVAAWAEARETQSYRDAAYIAAFSPDVALALLTEVETLRKALAEAARIAHASASMLLNGSAGRVHAVAFEACTDSRCAKWRAALVSEEGSR